MGEENMIGDGAEHLRSVDGSSEVVEAGRTDVTGVDRPGHRLLDAVAQMKAKGEFDSRARTAEDADKPRDSLYRGPRIDVTTKADAWDAENDRSRD